MGNGSELGQMMGQIKTKVGTLLGHEKWDRPRLEQAWNRNSLQNGANLSLRHNCLVFTDD